MPLHPYRDCAMRAAVAGPHVMRVMVFFDGAWVAIDHIAAGEYSIGPEAGASMSVAAGLLPGPRFPLLRHDGHGWLLRFTPSMTGSLVDGYAARSLSELSPNEIASPDPELPGVRVVRLQLDTRARISVGATTFDLASVPPPVRQSLRPSVDWAPFRYAAGAAAVVAVAFGLMLSVPGGWKPLEAPLQKRLRLFACVMVLPPPADKEQVPDWLKRRDSTARTRHRLMDSDARCHMGRRTSEVLRWEVYLDSPLLGAIPIDDTSLLASLYRDLKPLDWWRGTDGVHPMGLHHRAQWDSCICSYPCCVGGCGCLGVR